MPGAWELRDAHRVLVGILHVDHTSMAWALGLRNLQIPGAVMPVAGMPYDMARNVICMKALEGGFSHCLRGESMVETAGGSKRIRDIVVGDVVRTHLGNLKEVTQVFCRELPRGAELRWVHTPHSTIKCTPEHPFFVSRAGGPGRFVRAHSLEPGDEILYPADQTEDWLNFDIAFNTTGARGDGKLGAIKNGQELGRVPVTRELARFLGLYLAEGCPTGGGIVLTFHNEEEEYIQVVSRVAQTLFGRKPSITKRWATSARVNVRPLGKLFAIWFGRGAHNVRVPEFVYGWNLANRLSFLRGYLEGDGTRPKDDGHWAFSTVSNSLVTDISRLAAGLGIAVKSCRAQRQPATLKTGQVIPGGVRWNGWLTTSGSRKMDDLLSGIQRGGYIHIPIRAVQTHRLSYALRDRSVYNLEVADDHSYIADCASVHNCFFLDSDVIPPPDTISRLLAHRLPIVSGMYCRRSPPHGLPVMIRNGQWFTDFVVGQMVEVDMVGAGCLLIQREVLEKMQPQRPQAGKHWFDWKVDARSVLPDGQALSEDFSFCVEVRRQLGVRVMVDTSIQCRHVGLAQATLGQMTPCEATPVT